MKYRNSNIKPCSIYLNDCDHPIESKIYTIINNFFELKIKYVELTTTNRNNPVFILYNIVVLSAYENINNYELLFKELENLQQRTAISSTHIGMFTPNYIFERFIIILRI